MAFAASADFLELDDGWPGVREGLRAGGVDPVVVGWDDPSVEWDTFDLIVAVYTWGYVLRRDEFLEWADRTSAVAPLANSAGLLRWNTDKTYLRGPRRRGPPHCSHDLGASGRTMGPAIDRLRHQADGGQQQVEAARYATSDRAVAEHHVQAPPQRRENGHGAALSAVRRRRRRDRAGVPRAPLQPCREQGGPPRH